MLNISFLFHQTASYTYEKVGAQNVGSTTSGGERTKISMAFTASSDGRKLPILIILPRKNPLKDFQIPNNVVILYKPKSKTFDSQVMRDVYVDKIIKPYMKHHNKSKLILHLDNSPVHKKNDLLELFSYNNVQVSYFPPRMTSLLQPADVGWFKSIKSQYQCKWQEWYLNEPKSFTKAHNMKSPGYSKVCLSQSK